MDIIVAGAGAAGLTAAGELARAGMNVTILEARDRIGGRLHTIHDPLSAAPVELGAEFVHGRPREIFDLIQRHRLVAVEGKGDHLCLRKGRLVKCDNYFDSVEKVLDQMGKSKKRPDESFERFLSRVKAGDQIKLQATNYVESFNAARKEDISVHALADQQEAEEASGGDRMFRIATGYDTIATELARGIPRERSRMYLNTPVERIEWRRGRVRVNDRFTAARMLITVPLGVLKAGKVRIDPEPKGLAEALDAMEMGHAARVVFRFRERFWDEREDLASMSFMHAEHREPWRVWWSLVPVQAPILTAWAGGPRASSDPGIAIQTLSKLLNKDAAEIEEQCEARYFHDWTADPWSLGAYSYVRVGGLPAAKWFSQPVEDTLYFAGEHTDTTANWGTVHAAIGSGLRAYSGIARGS